MLRFERFLLGRVKYVFTQENLSFIRVTFILTVLSQPTMTSYNAQPSAHSMWEQLTRNQVSTQS